MSLEQNLLYATVQGVHNLGAVAAVGGSLTGALLRHPQLRTTLARIVLAGWIVQALSGASFGAVTYHYNGKFPDIGDTATTALYIKMACVAGGTLLMAACLAHGRHWSAAGQGRTWLASSLLALTALCSAAVLRWFS